MIFLADYGKAVRTAIEVLEDYEIPQAPVNLQLIFDALPMELSLNTYSDFMRSTGKTFEETVEILDSNLGACLYNPQTEQYAIFYNANHVDEFCRFTIAHELGHYFLGHHRLAGTTILNRSYMSRSEYEEYEKEANAFARNLLSPAPLAYNLREASLPGSIVNNFEMAFSITSLAAKVRASLLNRDLRDYNDHMREVALAINMKCQPFCWKCKTRNPVDVSYCITCGSGRVSWFTFYNPLPPAVKFDKNGLFYYCPRCGNNDISEDAEFCIICGLPLKNPCDAEKQTGIRRRHYNASNAKFCARCGSATRYNHIGFYPSMEGVTEMKYSDGVDYDLDTMKIKICPKCQNEEFSEQAEFCRICGTDLYNKCIGDEDTDNFGNYTVYNQHANPSNARYCEVCGKITLFYKNKLLKPYEDYLAEMEAEYAMAAAMAAQENEEAAESVTADPDFDPLDFF